MKITLALLPVFVVGGYYVWTAFNAIRDEALARPEARLRIIVIAAALFGGLALWFGWGVRFLSRLGG